MTISQILPGLRLFSARTSIGRDYESIYDLGEFMRRKKQDWLIHSSSKPWRIYGKLGENSDANTGLRSPCPNFHPKNVWPKVRTDFHDLTLCGRPDHFSEEKVQERFSSVVQLSPLRGQMVARLSEAWSEIPTLGPNLSEYSPNLPPSSL